MISLQSKYALKALVDLAVFSQGSALSLKSIAQREDIPLKYLEKIFQLLVKAKIVISQRGNQGGYYLYGKPSDITLLSVLKATDNSFITEKKEEKEPGYLGSVVSEFEKDYQKKEEEYLQNKTLQDLVDKVTMANDYVI